MALIGLVLLAAAAAFGIDVAAQNFFDLDVEVFGRTFATSPSAVFVAGVVTGLVGVAGVFLLTDGIRRRRRIRGERRATVAERDRLAAAYEAEHPEVGRTPVRDADTVDIRDRDRVSERASDRADNLSEHDRIVTY